MNKLWESLEGYRTFGIAASIAAVGVLYKLDWIDKDFALMVVAVLTGAGIARLRRKLP